jgi:DNA-binding MarR family transcriptional regulator
MHLPRSTERTENLLYYILPDMVTMNTLEAMFGRTAHIVVLEYLIKNRDTITYLSGIAEATGLSHSSVARVVEPLLQRGIIKENDIGKKMRIFTLNEDNEALQLLIRFCDDLDELEST